jgi:predicted metal-binding protein
MLDVETNELHASGMFYASFLFRGCGKCHTCGSELSAQCHCAKCGRNRRYSCHGYIGDDHDSTPCNQNSPKLNLNGE